ncbi:hypothetical protein [Nocardia blacklockiae]|uniref:hypothetical protein n=1 Tax=Nocardia blacklockiae TaxID=480036 RepID=UPI001893BD5C|nr:hypothetical protein [Nocardia blacklockiae]MBF6174903.1 hypothetical protein [Nocardia blacklockiae]
MGWSRRIRQAHRWLGVVFTATVVVTVVVLALRGPVWVSYVPLVPLALLLISGIYLLVRYARRRGRGDAVVTVRGWVRPTHRWSAVVLLVTMVATVVALAQEEPVVWVSYLPLLPLAVLLGTGLYMFAKTYAATRRGGASVARA